MKSIESILVTQQYDFTNKVPKTPTQSTAEPSSKPAAAAPSSTASGEQQQPAQEAKDKKEKKKKPANEGFIDRFVLFKCFILFI